MHFIVPFRRKTCNTSCYSEILKIFPFSFLVEQFVLRVHEGPVEAPQLWREVTINKKTTVRDVIVSRE